MNSNKVYQEKKVFYDRLVKLTLALSPLFLISAIVLMIIGKYQVLMIILTILFLLGSTLTVYFAKEAKKYYLKHKKQQYLSYANENDLAFSRIIRAYDSKLFIKELQKMNFTRIKHSIDTIDETIIITISGMFEDYFIELELDEEEFGFNMNKVEVEDLIYYRYEEFIKPEDINQSFKLVCVKIEMLIQEFDANEMKIIIED
jgi:preprotein translocase subunit SecG